MAGNPIKIKLVLRGTLYEGVVPDLKELAGNIDGALKGVVNAERIEVTIPSFTEVFDGDGNPA